MPDKKHRIVHQLLHMICKQRLELQNASEASDILEYEKRYVHDNRASMFGVLQGNA